MGYNKQKLLIDYHFTSKQQKESLLSKCRSSDNCIWIESKGGIDGSTLKRFICSELQSKSVSVKNMEVSDWVSGIRNKQEIQSTLLKHDIIVMDGFQQMYEVETEISESFEQFLRRSFKKGGRLIVKSNPTKNMYRFRQFLSGYQHDKIQLHKVNRKVSEYLLNEIYATTHINWDQNIKETILSLKFHNYRMFEGFVLTTIAYEKVYHKTISKKMILNTYEQFCLNHHN